MRIEILVNGVVDNTIEADEVFAEEHFPGMWRVADQQEAPVSPASPSVCSPAQGLAALFVLHELTQEDILRTISGIPDPTTRYTAQIAFSRATEWRRDSPAMGQLTELLGLSGVDLDALFAFAATVEL